MAGKDPAGNFDGGFFRTQIRATMAMGLPNATNSTVTFRWTTKHSYGVADPAGHPYNWGATPTTTTAHADVAAICAVQFKEKDVTGDGVGTWDPSQAIITILDEDYVAVAGADQVLIGGDTYNIDVVSPPQGLFDVDIYTIYARARDAK